MTTDTRGIALAPERPQITCEPPALRTRGFLLAVCIGGAMLETGLVGAFGPGGAIAISPQGTAPPPFGLFHDLRWLAVYHQSWLTLAAELVALVLVRTTLNGIIIRASWPRGVEPPAWRRLFRAGAIANAVGALVLAPWVAALFGMAVISVSWLIFAGVVPLLMIAVFLHQGAVVSTWWRRRPTLRALGWVGLTFLVLTLAGAAEAFARPWPLALIAAAATGLFNAWAWVGVVHAIVCRNVPEGLPLAPVGIVLIFVVIVGGSALGFKGHGETVHLRRSASAVRPRIQAPPVVVARGFGSSWNGQRPDDLGGSVAEYRFSYRGLDGQGLPLAYTAKATEQTLPALVRLMDEEVRSIAARTHSKVVLVGESEGSVIAKAYVFGAKDPPVARLIMLSPLVHPARVYYPPRGRQGWGTGTGWVLRGVNVVLRQFAPLDLSPDAPLVRSIDDEAPTVRYLFACRTPGVAEDAFIPLADAAAAPRPATQDVPIAVVPSFHGGLLGDRQVDDAIDVVLSGGPLPELSVWRAGAELVRGGAAAWQVPELPLRLNPVWRAPHEPEPETEPNPARCADIHTALAVWLS